MTDLRENIYELLTKWRMDIHNDTAADGSRNYWANKPASTYDIADRILALLPKMPELRWDEYNNLMLGDIDDGLTAGEVAIDAGGTWLGGTSHEWIDQRFTTREQARAAVETAVRKALGWEE